MSDYPATLWNTLSRPQRLLLWIITIVTICVIGLSPAVICAVHRADIMVSEYDRGFADGARAEDVAEHGGVLK